ncbi:SWIM zinc finger [Paenibacillaceae bacterium GAS479]|nr:SWIM zinc finger [Paenibacillaceae bacterium GAS479]
MAFYNDFPEYVPVAEKKRRAAAAVEKLKKKDNKVWPIVISGRTIAATWWGKAWCSNLESYADYSNRIDRGRSYVRHGAVLDLQVAQGKVAALVQGSSSKPYKIEVKVTPLSNEMWNSIVKECSGKINSLQELAAGKFPKGLSDLFIMKSSGLFPSPKDIQFSCSCPDYAVMCKHVAAVLYGIGARFDDNAALFFELRMVKMDELITASLAEQSKTMLGKDGRRGRRVMEDGDLAGTFGIDLNLDMDKEPTRTRAGSSTADAAIKPRRGRPPKNKAADVAPRKD